jgi:membrane-associated phospholipid phosphatase
VDALTKLRALGCPNRLALSWGPLVALAVVATGNHFVFDVVAGLIVTAAGFGLGALARRPIASMRTPTPAPAPAR